MASVTSKPLLFARKEAFGYLFYDVKKGKLYTLKTKEEISFDNDLQIDNGLSENIYPSGTIKLLHSKITRADILSAPTGVDLYPTLFCNERCEFCYIGDRLNSYLPGLKREDAVKISDQLSLNGIFGVSILGGEPFLYKDLDWLLTHLNDCGFELSLSTNGTIYDHNIIKKVRDYGVSFTLSFHSHMPGIHSNIVKNKIAFSKELETLRNVIKEGVDPHVTTLVTRSNYSTLLDTIDFLISEDVRRITLFHTSKSGFALQNPETGVDFWEYKALFQKAVEIGNKHNVEITSRTNFPFLIYEDMAFDNDPELSNLIYGTIDTRRVLSIVYDGSTHSTTYNLPDKVSYLGNIFQTSLNEIWVESKNLNSLRNAKLPVPCNTCKHFRYCRGGSIINYKVHESNALPECPLHVKPLLAE